MRPPSSNLPRFYSSDASAYTSFRRVGAVVGTDPASVDADMATTELPFVVRGGKTALTADL